MQTIVVDLKMEFWLKTRKKKLISLILLVDKNKHSIRKYTRNTECIKAWVDQLIINAYSTAIFTVQI